MTPVYPVEKAWYVVRVKPHAERKMKRWLERFGIWRYLPTYTVTRKVQRRKVVREFPVFPGYIVSRMDAAGRLLALKSNMTIAFLVVERPREFVHQLRQVVRAARSARELKPVPIDCAVGQLVRIKDGPLQGLEGRIKHNNGKAVLVLSVEALGQAVEVRISAADCYIPKPEST